MKDWMKGGVPIGKAFGIPLRLHYSWFAIFALVTLSLSASYFPDTYPEWSTAKSVIAGLLTSLLFFASLLGHELMHSIIAQRRGIPIRSITLFILGGVSEMTEEPKKARDELLIALAGPLTSLVLGLIFFAVWFGLRDTSQFIEGVSWWVGWINISLAVFNLVPGFPLDGGRVARAILWGRSQNLRKATRTASDMGRMIGYLFIFGGVLIVFAGNLFSGLWLIFIGWFLHSAAEGSYRQVALQDILRGHTVREIMVQDCTVVPPDTTIEGLVHENILTSGRRCFPVVENGKAKGLVSIHSIKAVPKELWPIKMVRDAMVPLDQLKSVHPGDELLSVMQLLTGGDINQLPVVDENNNVVGIVARDKLLAFINLRSELGM